MLQTLSVTEPKTLEPRQYAQGEKYILPIDKLEGNRLDLQHRVIKSAFESQVLLAPHEDNNSYLVLDSGVGSGAWILEVAAKLPPTAILHGVDIDISRVPPEYPKNVSFSKASALALPAAWTSRFDFVHQRLLVLAFTSVDWKKALSEIFRVLLPGGWVQLGEHGRKYVDGTKEEREKWPATVAWYDLLRAFYTKRGLVYKAGDELPKLLSEAGFTNIRVERRTIGLGPSAGDQGRDAAQNLITAYHAMKDRVEQSGVAGSGVSVDKVIENVRQEWNTNPGAESEFIIVVAQKPLQ